jgi:hypothetical protein
VAALPSDVELEAMLGRDRWIISLEDFSRRNPIHRWWDGTELTSDHLWRWDPVLIAP